LTLQHDANLPIWQTLAAGSAVILLVQIRYRVLRRAGRKSASGVSTAGGTGTNEGEAGKDA